MLLDSCLSRISGQSHKGKMPEVQVRFIYLFFFTCKGQSVIWLLKVSKTFSSEVYLSGVFFLQAVLCIQVGLWVSEVQISVQGLKLAYLKFRSYSIWLVEGMFNITGPVDSHPTVSNTAYRCLIRYCRSHKDTPKGVLWCWYRDAPSAEKILMSHKSPHLEFGEVVVE